MLVKTFATFFENVLLHMGFYIEKKTKKRNYTTTICIQFSREKKYFSCNVSSSHVQVISCLVPPHFSRSLLACLLIRHLSLFLIFFLYFSVCLSFLGAKSSSINHSVSKQVGSRRNAHKISARHTHQI